MSEVDLTHINIIHLGAPYVALFLQACWSVVLILLPGSSFASLLDYAGLLRIIMLVDVFSHWNDNVIFGPGPAAWLYYALTGSSVIYLRYSEPDLVRPFSVPCYPLPPILLVLMAVTIVISSLMRSPLYCFLAMFFIAISIPVWMAVEYCTGSGQGDFLRLNLTGSDSAHSEDDDKGDRSSQQQQNIG